MRKLSNKAFWIIWWTFALPQAVLLLLKLTKIVTWNWLIIILPVIIFDALILLTILIVATDRLQKHIHR